MVAPGAQSRAATRRGRKRSLTLCLVLPVVARASSPDWSESWSTQRPPRGPYESAIHQQQPVQAEWRPQGPPPPPPPPLGDQPWPLPDEPETWSEPPPHGPPEPHRGGPPGATYHPIDYQFPSRPLAGQEADAAAAAVAGDDASPAYASPRQDAIARYMSDSRGRLLVRASASVMGAGLGAFCGRSWLGRPQECATIAALLFLVATFFRSDYAELVKALALTGVFLVQRSYRVRRRYPTYRHVQSALGLTARRPFPPTNNLWQYQPLEGEPDFNMLYAMMALAVVGSLCGGNLPLLPTWLGALAGAALLASATTLASARGDLARTMGMRVIGYGGELLAMNRELGLMSKAAVVGGRLLDKALILDRKHRIKDRVMSIVTAGYDQAMRLVQQAQGQQVDDDDRNRRGPGQRPPRYEDDQRRRYEDDADRRPRNEYTDRRRPPDDRRPRESREGPYERRPPPDPRGRPQDRDERLPRW